MAWVIIERIIHLLTLVLLIVMISIIMTNNKSSEDFGNFSLKLQLFKDDYIKVANKNMNYFDTRVNKLAEIQDDYQVSTSQRVYVLEQRVKDLQVSKTNNQKIINNSNSNAVVYSGKEQ